MASPSKPPQRSLRSEIFGDLIVMALYVFISSTFEEIAAYLAPAVGVSGLTAGLTVLILGLMAFEPICAAVGGEGASFNPALNFAFAASGSGSYTRHTLRSLGQAVGGVLGAAAAFCFIPASWQGSFSNLAVGMKPGVTLTGGMLCEGCLAFSLAFIILWSMGTRWKRFGWYTSYLATVPLVLMGTYTGPFMNPAFSFSWWFHYQKYPLWEHLLVYWLAVVIGSICAGWLWSVVSAPKKARTSKARQAAMKGAHHAAPQKVAAKAD